VDHSEAVRELGNRLERLDANWRWRCEELERQVREAKHSIDEVSRQVHAVESGISDSMLVLCGPVLLTLVVSILIAGALR